MHPLLTPPVRELMRVIDAGGHSSRLVGGAVRDWVIGQAPKDLDLCTTATPEQTLSLMQAAGIRIEETGLQHGTVMAILDGEGYEITTLRRDVTTDGRHAQVEIVTDYRADAARRDFTMNAMSVDGAGLLHDYFGGIDDLRAKRLRFVGNAAERVEEDYLRVLRGYRFAAQFGLDLGPADRKAMASGTAGLHGIARERIWQEMRKLLVAPSASLLVEEMASDGVLDHIGLCLRQDGQSVPMFTLRAKRAATDPCELSPAAMLGLLCGASSAAQKTARVWKLSGAERRTAVDMGGLLDRLEHLTIHEIEDQVVDGLARSTAVIALAAVGRHDEARALSTWTVPTFPVAGRDLIVRGAAPGPALGNELSRLRTAWRATRYTATTDALLDLVPSA